MKIRYYGHNGLLSGYGRAADEMVEALAAAGAELEVRPLAPPASWNRNVAVSRFFKTDDELTQPDAIIVHTLPLSVDTALNAIGDHGGVDAPTVVYTTWEALNVPPRVVQAVRGGDQLWVPSKATRHAFENAALDLQVRVVPHAYDDTRSYGYVGDREDAPFTFYYVGAWTARKNPTGMLRAFCAEFGASESVRLVLQCHGVPREQFIVAMAQTGIPQDQWPKVTLSNQELTEPELWALHACADVFVTASRGEAWNLPAFEAMLAGRHVIAPMGLGSDDFLEDTSAARYMGLASPAVVDIRQAPSGTPGTLNLQVVGAQGLDCRSEWTEPDLMALRKHMRHAFQMNIRTIDVHYDVAAEFGRRAVGQRAINLLEEIKKP